MNLNELAARVHEANKKWWVSIETGEPIVRNKDEQLMLVVSEIAEAMEGARKGQMDDHLPHRKMEEVEMADAIIRLLDYVAGHGRITLEGLKFYEGIPENKGQALFHIVCAITCFGDVEASLAGEESVLFSSMVDLSTTMQHVFNLIHTYCTVHNLDLWGAFEDKMEYNAHRHDHTLEARRAVGGKVW